MRIRSRSTIYLYSISVCMGSIVIGYSLTSYSQISYLVNTNNQIDQYLEYVNVNSLVNHLLPLAAIFGASLYRCSITSLGFIKTFAMLDIATILACLIGALSFSAYVQFIYRILLGLVVGLNTILIPTYLTSCLPGSMGGPAGTLNQVFITVGIFLGYLFGLSCSDIQISNLTWRLIILFPILPVIIRIYTTKYTFPYETVEYMIQTNNHGMLQKYIDHIWEDTTFQEFKVSKQVDQEDIIAENSSVFDELGRSFRQRFKVVSLFIFFNLFSGNNSSYALARYVFPQVDGTQHSQMVWAFVKLTFVQVIATFITGQLLEKYGRKAFIFEGIRIMLGSNILIALIQYAAPQLKTIQYCLVYAQVIGFSLSFGPCCFLITTQILYDATYPAITFWVLTFLFGLLNDSLFSTFGVATLFLLFAAVSTFGLIYLNSFLVETQGKSKRQVFRQYRQMFFPHSLKEKQFLTKGYPCQEQSFTPLVLDDK